MAHNPIGAVTKINSMSDQWGNLFFNAVIQDQIVVVQVGYTQKGIQELLEDDFLYKKVWRDFMVENAPTDQGSAIHKEAEIFKRKHIEKEEADWLIDHKIEASIKRTVKKHLGKSYTPVYVMFPYTPDDVLGMLIKYRNNVLQQLHKDITKEVAENDYRLDRVVFDEKSLEVFVVKAGKWADQKSLKESLSWVVESTHVLPKTSITVNVIH